MPGHIVLSLTTIHPWRNMCVTAHGLKDKSWKGDGSACKQSTLSFAASESFASIILDCYGEGVQDMGRSGEVELSGK
jgi:hypothetical protein